jgi:hypothetical protein
MLKKLLMFEVRDNWSVITDYTGAVNPDNIQESVATIMDKLSRAPAAAKTGAWSLADIVR